MSTYMPPISRKKRVGEKYDPNTFRVFGDLSKGKQSTVYKTSHSCDFKDNPMSKALPYESIHHTKKHTPHAWTADFLRQNCRFVNEPICMVYTDRDNNNDLPWWPREVVRTPDIRVSRTNDTTIRRDYGGITNQPPGLTRHACNPNTKSALGIVPVNKLREPNGSQRFYKEKISYQHQYNSRLEPSYPIRSKRHGAFVWDAIPSEAIGHYLNHSGYRASEPVYTPKGPITTQDSEIQSNGSIAKERPSSIEKLPLLTPTIAQET